MEECGIATTQISLIREHTEAIKPPRALWVPFMLGRPFGVPNDPAFQTRVLVAALDLFQRPAGPLLEDYPEDAPVGADDGDVQVCPVAFGREVEVTDLGAVFLREMQALLPWHDLARERRGRTVTGLTEQSVRDSAEMLAAFISGTDRAAGLGTDAWRDSQTGMRRRARVLLRGGGGAPR